MRSKMVRSIVDRRDYLKAEVYRGDKEIFVFVGRASHNRVICLTPHRARELGEALCQMADEKEKA